MAWKVSLKEVYQMARDAYWSLWDTAKRNGRDVKVILHWSAGYGETVFNDYHINITDDGTLWCTGEFDETKSHSWRKNSGAIGVSLCCAYGATSKDIGENGPTPIQIEQMARVIAVICDALDLTIDIKHVPTHGEAADNADGDYTGYGPEEEYGPRSTVERWDLQYLGTNESPVFLKDYDDPRTGGNVLRGKALWFRNYWKEHPEERPY